MQAVLKSDRDTIEEQCKKAKDALQTKTEELVKVCCFCWETKERNVERVREIHCNIPRFKCYCHKNRYRQIQPKKALEKLLWKRIKSWNLWKEKSLHWNRYTLLVQELFSSHDVLRVWDLELFLCRFIFSCTFPLQSVKSHEKTIENQKTENDKLKNENTVMILVCSRVWNVYLWIVLSTRRTPFSYIYTLMYTKN